MATAALAPRHMSRWRLAAGDGSTKVESEQAEGGEAMESAAPTSLRYLNEFVAGLQCAPTLLQHGLFPDAKEITESMGLFNAVRRYLLPAADAATAAGALMTDGKSDKPDGIVVVGDGNTPRSAAMFAFRLRRWKCYSIDPAMEMQSSERSRGWATIDNLVVVRNKIENVRISLRRAIVVLVHAHVTLEQALSSVDAEQVVGVVTMPCCNWYSRQEQLFGRLPDLVYDDFSILSDHREIRLWVDESRSKALDAQRSDLADTATGMMKGCIRKVFDVHASMNTETEVSTPPADGGRALASSSKRRRLVNAVAFLGGMFDQLKLSAAHNRGREEEQNVSEAAVDAVAAYVPKNSSILVLDCQPDLSWTRAMLQRGYASVYVLKKQPEGYQDGDVLDQNATKLSLELIRFHSADPTTEVQISRTIELRSPPIGGPGSRNYRGEGINASIHTTGISLGDSDKPIYIVDAGFLYRGFRLQPKNSALFRNVCHMLELIAHECFPRQDEPAASVALVSVTGSKAWRKKEYFGHPELGYTVSSTLLAAASPSCKPLSVFSCIKGSIAPTTSPTQDALAPRETSMRDRILALKRSLESDFSRVVRSLGASGSLDAATVTAKSVIAKIVDALSEQKGAPTRRHFVVTGKITRVRRFSHGVAFVSLVEAEKEAATQDIGLQVFIHDEVLQAVSLSVPFVELVSLLRRGDAVTVVGFARESDRGRQMLAALGVKFESGGEFEAF